MRPLQAPSLASTPRVIARGAALRFALRRLRRALGAGELRVLALAVIVACAAASAVGVFSDRMLRAIERGAAETLGADARLQSHDPLTAEHLAALDRTGVRRTVVVKFPTVVSSGDATQLASVKAVEAGYPILGVIRLSASPDAAVTSAIGIPPPGETWIDRRLWTLLKLQPGATLQVGALAMRVGAVIADEPGHTGGMADLEPEVMINAADLPASQLIGPGSRVEYRVQLAGSEAQINAVADLQASWPGVQLERARDAQKQIGDALGTAHRFLNLAVLATLLLSGAAIALAARVHAASLIDEVAVLKCLGAGSPYLRRALIWQLLILGVVAALVGTLLGGIAQSVLALLAAPLLSTPLPAPHPLPALVAMATGVLMLVGFALPPVWRATTASPMRVFQRSLELTGRSGIGTAVAVLAVVGLVVGEAGEPKLALEVAGAAAGTAGVLAALAFALVRLLDRWRRRPAGLPGGAAMRLGLGNLARRRGAAVAQIVALGVAMLALLLVTVVRSDLLHTWQQGLAPGTPNEFLLNIQPDQLPALKDFFASNGLTVPEFVPMARSRLQTINGKPVDTASLDSGTRDWINREFNFSWTAALPPDNKITAGKWWTPADHGKPYLSADGYAVEHLKLKLGDKLGLDFEGHSIELELTSTRTVRWDDFRPNFFLLTPPGVLDNVPTQWLTSLYVPPERQSVMRALTARFPNVTPLDLTAVLDQIRGIVARITRALSFIFLFALLAGLVVLMAVIEASRAERARETAVLRTLGASSRLLNRALLVEYALAGVLAGGIAALAAQTLAWILASEIFHLPYGPRPLIWLAGAGGGGILVTLTGWLSLRRVLRTPPRQVLAG